MDWCRMGDLFQAIAFFRVFTLVQGRERETDSLAQIFRLSENWYEIGKDKGVGFLLK